MVTTMKLMCFVLTFSMELKCDNFKDSYFNKIFIMLCFVAKTVVHIMLFKWANQSF